MYTVFSIWGYVDLRLVLHTFDKASKEGATETRFPKGYGSFQLNKIKFVASKYAQMDCLKAAENYVLTSLTAPHEPLHNGSRSEKVKIEIKNAASRCQTAKEIIFDINDNLMLLIVLVACALNMIFQSGVPIFNGKPNIIIKYNC